MLLFLEYLIKILKDICDGDGKLVFSNSTFSLNNEGKRLLLFFDGQI